MTLRRLGYPCVRHEGPQTVKTCQLKNATEKRLRELIDRNLNRLRDVLEYNLEHDITFFRIHSDTIPFASHPDVQFDWRTAFEGRLRDLGRFIIESDVRVSMHPGQYTVLNSKDPSVVENAVRNLEYHASFLDALGLDGTAKIVIHVGGVYGDKPAAMDRFVERSEDLSDAVRRRLVIENDESSYDPDDVVSISSSVQLPVVFDWLHNRLNPSKCHDSIEATIQDCTATWRSRDGPPIVHFSSPSGRSGGHHGDRVDPAQFREFLDQIVDLPPMDVMLECKHKEVALLELRDDLNALETDLH